MRYFFLPYFLEWNQRLPFLLFISLLECSQIPCSWANDKPTVCMLNFRVLTNSNNELWYSQQKEYNQIVVRSKSLLLCYFNLEKVYLVRQTRKTLIAWSTRVESRFASPISHFISTYVLFFFLFNSLTARTYFKQKLITCSRN